MIFDLLQASAASYTYEMMMKSLRIPQVSGHFSCTPLYKYLIGWLARWRYVTGIYSILYELQGGQQISEYFTHRSAVVITWNT